MRDYENLSAYLDGQLSAAEKTRLEERIRANPELRLALDELSRTRALVRSAPRHRAPRNFTLTPAMVQARKRKAGGFFNFFPVLSFASAVATLALVISFLLGAGPAGAPAREAAPATLMEGGPAEATAAAALPAGEIQPDVESQQKSAVEAAVPEEPAADARAQGQAGPVITWGFPPAPEMAQAGKGGFGMGGELPPAYGRGGGAGDIGSMGGGAQDGSLVIPLESAENLESQAPAASAAQADQFAAIPTLEGSGPVLGVPEAGQAGKYLNPLPTPLPKLNQTDSEQPAPLPEGGVPPSAAQEPARWLRLPPLRVIQLVLGLLAVSTGAAAVWLWRKNR